MADMTLPKELERMDQGRLRAYAEALGFYSGSQWLGPNRRRERRLTFNYVRAFLDKVTSCLMRGMTVVAQPSDPSPEAAERARRAGLALQRMAAGNALEQLDFETELDTAVLGDGCYKVLWEEGAPPGGVDGSAQGRAVGRVRITAPDVQGLFAWWVGDDFAGVWRVASRYRLTAQEAESVYGSSPRGAYATVVEVWTASDFALFLDGELLEERPNPYGFIPFAIFPNVREPKQFWGSSDVGPLVEPQRELNRAFSQLSSILELSGNPIAVLEGIEEAHDIAVQPGAVWEVPERARAYLLDLLQGGGVRLHTDYIDLLYRTLHDLSGTPRTAFGDSGRDLSGVALEMELYPLVQRVERKRLIRTAVYRRRAEMALRVQEQMTGEALTPVRLQVAWGSIFPQDRERTAREEQLLVASGLHSRHRAMVSLGVEDPEGEVERIRREQAGAGGAADGLQP